MPADPVFEIGDKVVGHGHFRELKGKVVDFKETYFGFRYALVKQKDGKQEWARTILLKEKD